MTKKEIVEYLKQNMPNFQGTEEEIEIKTALYIYVELGKIKSFDDNYYFGNEQARKKIHDLAQMQKEDVDKIAQNRKIVCVSLTYLYNSILKEFGIFARASIPEEERGHIYSIIITKSNKSCIADLQLDLENIQTKSRLEHFKYIDDLWDKENHLKQEEITKILMEIGYIKDEKEYKNEEIDRLIGLVRGMNPHKALQTILEDEQLYGGNEEMDIVEINQFYRKLLKKIIPHFIEKKIYTFNCYREQDGEKNYTLCAFSEEDTIKTYLFSKKNKRFLPVEISKMKELQEQGLKLGARPKENGVNKLKRYIQRQFRKEEIEFGNQ